MQRIEADYISWAYPYWLWTCHAQFSLCCISVSQEWLLSISYGSESMEKNTVCRSKHTIQGWNNWYRQMAHYVLWIPFLPTNEVEDCFVEDVMCVAPTDSKCHQFSDYIRETYISSTAKFRPGMWSAVPCAELKRTTNGPESFHSHFNQKFYLTHPTIFAFVDVILKLQTTTYVKIRSLDLPANTRKNDQEKIYFLLDQYRQYSCGDISRQQYVLWLKTCQHNESFTIDPTLKM